MDGLSKDETLFWLEEDCSLHNGIEIISQPCTLEYHQTQFPWAKIAEVARQYGGKSHDTETCGLHIHFNKSFLDGKRSELYQLRLLYLFERVWDGLVAFSRRDFAQLATFAQKLNVPLLEKPARKNLRDLRRAGRCSHTQCVNLTGHAETVEIRIFRGTLDVITLLASVELVDFLVRIAKKLSTKKLQLLTWNELARKIDAQAYPNLAQYLGSIGLAYKEEENNVLNCS